MAVDDGRHPAAERLAEYADGVLEVEARAEIERHLADCAECRAVVMETVAFLEDSSASAASAPALRVVPFRSRRWVTGVAGLAAAAALVLAVVPGARWWDRPPFAALDEAYSRQRPVEVRFPHANYGPLRVTRGGAIADQLPSVLDALSSIRRRLQSPDADARWFHASGSAALLMWQYDDAIRSLERAADLGERSPDLWIDLASAYFERAEANNTPHDYTNAVELLTKALVADPANPSALFNRAVVFSKLKQFDAAIADFNAALKSERDPGWASELRSRLKEAEEGRARLLGGSARIPAEFADEARFEDLLRHPDWAQAAAGVKTDLRSLAARLVADHRDRWLTEAVDVAYGRDVVRSVPVLGALARVRERVKIGDYAELTADIETLAGVRLPAPFAVWRDFELLYRASHSERLADCPDAGELRARASRLGYAWFEVQIALEQSTCQVGATRLDAAQEATLRAIAVADASGFRVASLRARGFLSSHLVNEARYQESFRIDTASLNEILRSGYPSARAHQFFNDMMRASEGLGRWTEARAAAQMAGAAAEASGYDLLAAQAAYKEASFAEASGHHELATRLYDVASARFSALPPSPDVRLYQALVEISGLANRGDYDGLLRRRSLIPEHGNIFFEIPLLTSLATLALDRHDSVAAEQYASLALRYGAGSDAPPVLIRREFSDVLERADALMVLARLERGETPAALTSWRQHLLRAAASVGPGAPTDRSGAPLEEGVGILTFANLHGKVGVWLHTRKGLEFQWATPSFPDLTVSLRQLVFLCQNPRASTSAIDALARDITRYTIAPLLRDQSTVTTVYVQAQGELGWLPLALSVAEPSRTFIVNPFGLRALISEQRRSQGASFLAVPSAARTRDVNLAALPGAEREVRDLAGLVDDAHLQIGASVTARSLDDAMRRYRLVHFAGHAIRSADGTALVVAPDPSDSRADAREGLWHLAPRTEIRAEIVVLSACSTAAIERLDSAAPNGLAEAVILAGAHSVVATLWDVESDVTERFNRAFYRSFVRHGSIVEAYRDARDDVRHDTAAAPVSWAAFALYTRVNEE